MTEDDLKRLRTGDRVKSLERFDVAASWHRMGTVKSILHEHRKPGEPRLPHSVRVVWDGCRKSKIVSPSLLEVA